MFTIIRKSTLQILNLIGFVLMVATNYAANALPLNDISTGEVADKYFNLLTPAGFTFSIWGLIYLLLLAFVIYQARDLFSFQKQSMPFLKQIGYLFFISSLLNTAWVFAWHYDEIIISMVLIFALLLVLILIYSNLKIGKKRIYSGETYWVHLPFRLYLGWIVVANLANVNVLLVSLGWEVPAVSAFWTVFLIAVATLITLLFLHFRRDLVIALVTLWALAGIVAERSAHEPLEVTIVVGAAVAMLIILIYGIKTLVSKPRIY